MRRRARSRGRYPCAAALPPRHRVLEIIIIIRIRIRHVLHTEIKLLHICAITHKYYNHSSLHHCDSVVNITMYKYVSRSVGGMSVHVYSVYCILYTSILLFVIMPSTQREIDFIRHPCPIIHLFFASLVALVFDLFVKFLSLSLKLNFCIYHWRLLIVLN